MTVVPKCLLRYSPCHCYFQLSRSQNQCARISPDAVSKRATTFKKYLHARFFFTWTGTNNRTNEVQLSTARSKSRNTQRYKITDKSSSSLHVTRGKPVVNNGWYMSNTFNISLNQSFLFFLQFLDRTKKLLLAKLLQSVQHKRNCNTGNNVITGVLQDGFLCLRNVLYSTDDFCLLPPPLDTEGVTITLHRSTMVLCVHY